MRAARYLALSVVLLALLPSTSAARSVTKTSGSVTATLSWKRNFAETEDFRIAIDRGGVEAFAAKVRTKACKPLKASFACPWPPLADQLVLRDLDGDGEPEAVVAGFTGGAHCCLVAIVYRWDGTRYVKDERNFGNPGYEVVDLDDDGLFEFRSRDDRFTYLYGSYAGSVDPILIERFDHGDFDNATAGFAAAVKKDMHALRREYRRRARSRRKFEVRAALAGYVADLYLLGRNKDAGQTLRSALDKGLLARQNRFDVGPFNRRFIRDLKGNLRDWGYL